MANGEQQGGAPGSVNPQMGTSPSLVSTGISLMASGLAQDGTLTPEGAQALTQFGQGMAVRMQDRWWRQEADNFRATRASQVRMQGQQVTQEYNTRLQEASKIADPNLRMQSMNEVHAWATEQQGNLSMQFWDMAAEFPNNPYITAMSNDLWSRMQGQFKGLMAAPVQAAATVQAQEQAITAGATTRQTQAQARAAEDIAPLAFQAKAQEIATSAAQEKSLLAKAAKAKGLSVTKLDQVMPAVLRAGSAQEKAALLNSDKDGRAQLQNQISLRMDEIQSDATRAIGQYERLLDAKQKAKGKEEAARADAALTQFVEEFKSEFYGKDPDVAYDKEARQFLFADLQKAIGPQVRDEAIIDIEDSWRSKMGVAAREPVEEPRPTTPAGGMGDLRIRERQEAETAPTTPEGGAKDAWGIGAESSPEVVSMRASEVNQGIQEYFAKQGEAAPPPVNLAAMSSFISRVGGGKSYHEMVAPKVTRALPPESRDKVIKDISEKVKQVLQMPEGIPNRDDVQNEQLFLLAVRYSRAVGRVVPVDEMLAEGLGMRAMSEADKKARLKELRVQFTEASNLLINPSISDERREQVRQKRLALIEEINALGEAATGAGRLALGAGRGVAGVWKAAGQATAQHEQKRQVETERRLKSLLGE